MQIFVSLKQLLRNKLLIIGTLCVSIVSSLFIFINQPTLAAPISPEGQKLMQQQKLDQGSQAADQARSQAYEEQLEAAKNIDKVFEDNARKTGIDENLIEKTKEGAQKLVETVTGND